ENKSFVQLNTMISPLLILAFFGLVYTFLRRRKFTSK
ncbi:MAG: hypothetical protein ACJAVH_002081, partial [Bacteroidia bacterium]